MTLETKPTVYYAIRVFTQFEMDQAIEAEREACAKVADAASVYNRFISIEIASEIRARGNT
jgi:hypothetical protein